MKLEKGNKRLVKWKLKNEDLQLNNGVRGTRFELLLPTSRLEDIELDGLRFSVT